MDTRIAALTVGCLIVLSCSSGKDGSATPTAANETTTTEQVATVAQIASIVARHATALREQWGVCADEYGTWSWLAVQQTDLMRGTWIDPAGGKVTFGEHAETWFAGQLHWSHNTRTMTRSRLDVHLLPFFETRPLASIRPSDVQEWVQGRTGVLAPASVEVNYRLAAQILRAAVNGGLIARTPCRDVKLPRVDRQQIRIPTRAEVWAIADQLPAHAQAAVALAAAAGLRLGETLGLTVDRIDFLRRQIRVDRQLQNRKGEGPVFCVPKSKASIRTIPVAVELTELLSTHVRAHQRDGLLLVNSRGTPWRASNFQTMWRDARKDAKLTEIRFHDLRHLYASTLIDSGASVKVIQARLGHASAVETWDTYGHLFPGDDDKTRAATGRLLVREKSAKPRTKGGTA